MKSFIVKLLLLSSLCVASVYGLQQFKTNWNLNPSYAAIVFYTLLTWLVYYISMLGFKRNAKLFIKSFLTSLTLHLLFSLGALTLYLIFNREKNIPFIISYLIFYVLFTLFEITGLITTLRSISKNDTTIEK